MPRLIIFLAILVAGASAQTCPYQLSESTTCFDGVYTCELCCATGRATNGADCWVGSFVRSACCKDLDSVSTPAPIQPTPPPVVGATPAPLPAKTPAPVPGTTPTPVLIKTPSPGTPPPTPAPIYVCPYLKDEKLNCFDKNFYTCESCCQTGLSTHGVSCWTFGFSFSDCCKTGTESAMEAVNAGMAAAGTVCPYDKDPLCWDAQYSCESCCLTGKSNGFSCWANGFTESRCCTNAAVQFMSAPSNVFTPPPIADKWANCPYNKDSECWGGIYDCNRCCTTGFTSLSTSCWDRVYTPQRCCTAYVAPATAVPQPRGAAAPTIADSTVQASTCPYYAGIAECFSTLYTCVSCCTTGRDVNGQFSCWDSQYNADRCCVNSPLNSAPVAVAPPLTFNTGVVFQPPTAPVTPSTAGACVDTMSACGIWSQIGECTGAASAYVRQVCPSSCNTCTAGFRRSQPRAWGGETDSRGLPLDSRGNPILPSRFLDEAGLPLGRPADQAESSTSPALGVVIGLSCAGVVCAVAAVAFLVIRRRSAASTPPRAVEMDVTASAC